MKRFLAILFAAGLTLPAIAQNDVDALRYSTLQFGSTARALGVGGAFGALGADFGSLSINPAGIGVYRKSEISITPTVTWTNTDATYHGDVLNDSRVNFNIGSGGAVFTKLNENYNYSRSGMKVASTSFAFGVNRLANFNNQYTYSGYNENSSLVDRWVGDLNANGGTNPSQVYNSDPFGAGLAWETYLINPTAQDSTQYYGESGGGGVRQTKELTSSGGINEMVFSMGTNIGHKVYVGGTVGVPFLRYNERSLFTEDDTRDQHANFEALNYETRLNTNGIGGNFKAGMIFRPSDFLRFGASFHTPTRYAMNDTYSSSLAASLDTAGNSGFDSPFGEYSYSLTTPWRVIGSAALVFKRFGLFTVDYEFVDYSQARYRFNKAYSGQDRFEEDRINDNIDAKYGPTHNIRGGIEVRLAALQLRAGVAYSTSPFNEGVAAEGADNSRWTYHAGLGVRLDGFYFDLAYVHALSTEYDLPYDLIDQGEVVAGAELDRYVGSAQLSMGFRF